MANHQCIEMPKVLWDVDAVQQFLAITQSGSGTQCSIQEYTHDLMTLDPGSKWILASQVSNTKFVEENDAQRIDVSESLKELPQNAEDSSSHQDETETTFSITTLGLLLLSTITHQRGSHNLSGAILKLTKDMNMKPAFKELIQNLPSLKKLNLPRLDSFVNFCIGHCVLCSSDGRVVKEGGILQAWCDIIEPLQKLLEGLIIDHIQESDTWTLPLPEPSNASSLRASFKTQRAAIYARFDSYDFTNDSRFQAGVQQIMKQLQSEGGGRNSNQQDLELQAKLFYFSRFFHKISKADYQAWLSQREATTRCDLQLQSNSENRASQDTTSGSCSSLSVNNIAQTKPGSACGHSLQPSSPTSTSVQNEDCLSSAQDMPSINNMHISANSTSTCKDVSSEMSNYGISCKNSQTEQSASLNLIHTSSEFVAENNLQVPTSDTFQPDIVTSDTATSDPATSDPMASSDLANSDPPPYPTSFLEIMQLVASGQEIPGIETLDIKPTNAPPTESKLEPVTKPWLKSK